MLNTVRTEKLVQKKTDIRDNPVGIPKEAVQRIVAMLDKHVSSLFVLFHQYQKHHWNVEGPQFRDLHLYLEDSYTRVHKDLDRLAERITALGGLPTSHPTSLVEQSYIEHEPEGMYSIRDSLTNDLEAEKAMSKELRTSIRTCDDLDDFATRRLLEKALEKVEDRAHHLEHYLEDDRL